jgi:preprotein translocase subunit SecF
MFKPLRLVPDDTKFRFMRVSRPAVFGSITACVLSLVRFVAIGLNYGSDFKGGTVMEVQAKAEVADIASLRGKVSGLGLGEVELQEFGSPRDVLIKFEAQEGGDLAQQEAIKKVRAAVASSVEIRRIEVVGPKVSGELKQQSSIAVLMAIIAVMIYIWFRFEWQFAIGAVASLSHDVVLTIGLFSILGIEFNLTIIAAILTTLNQMLPRTILTSVSTLLALGSLYIFGGEVIRGFTFAMIWGVFIGTYSSIFVAAPVLIYMGARIDQSSGPKVEEDAVEPAAS